MPTEFNLLIYDVSCNSTTREQRITASVKRLWQVLNGAVSYEDVCFQESIFFYELWHEKRDLILLVDYCG